MRGNCGYYYEHLVPSEGAVDVEFVDNGVLKDVWMDVNRVTGDGKEIRENETVSCRLSMTKNSVRLREIRKDPEYRRREKKCRKEREKIRV